MGAAMAWFAIEAVEGKVNEACLRLVRAGFEIWRPRDRLRPARRKGRGVMLREGRNPDNVFRQTEYQKVDRFGRYFFIDCVMSPSLLAEVEHTPGIYGFVRMGDEMPTPIPDAQWLYMREYQPERPWKWEDAYKVGMPIEITHGPLSGHIGKIVKIDKRGIFDVECEIFGRPTRAIIEVGHVSRATALATPGRTRETGNTSRSMAGEVL